MHDARRLIVVAGMIKLDLKSSHFTPEKIVKNVAPSTAFGT